MRKMPFFELLFGLTFLVNQGEISLPCVPVPWTGDREPLSPVHIFRHGNTMVVTGLLYAQSNSEKVAAARYQVVKGDWVLKGSVVTHGESWEAPKLRVDRRTGSLASVYVETRRYPEHMSACHAAARYAVREKWGFRNGKPFLITRKALDTPYNTLDTLMDKLKKGDLAWIRKRSATPSVYRQIVRLRPKLGKEWPNVWLEYDDARVLYLEELNREFRFVRKNGNWKVGSVTELED